MIKFLLLILFLLMGTYPLKAADTFGGDQEFSNELDSIKNPFEDGFPKPVVVVVKPVYHYVPPPKPRVVYHPKPRVVVPPVITLPALNLEGVIVSEDIHEAIIDDQVVPLLGSIEGVQVDSVTKEGVGLSFRGKKFFLKVE